MTGRSALAGRRILVVEDDMMMALTIEQALQEFGCVVVGPVGRLDRALLLAENEALDAAVLDVTIRGGPVSAVVERLRARGIPFLLASGHEDGALPLALRGQPRLTKPFTVPKLAARLVALCGVATGSEVASSEG